MPKERSLLIREGNIHQQVPLITQLPFKDTVNMGRVRSWGGFRDCSPSDTGDEGLGLGALELLLEAVNLKKKKSVFASERFYFSPLVP